MSISAWRDSDLSAWIRAQRPARLPGDPFTPHGFFLEDERSASGQLVKSAVILLTNKECPWTCLMCDLWKTTVTRSVPAGAIPRQVEFALRQLGERPPQVKLYNGGSFFDPAAIPVNDYSAIAQTVSFASHVIVESHPKLIGSRVLSFRDELNGTLEVALGLETVHPEILPLLNKRFELDDFARSTSSLCRQRIAVRAFILVKTPGMNEEEAVTWAVKSAEFAFECGVAVVSLIPTRPGNGALEKLMETGEFSPPRLSTLELAQERVLQLHRGRVFADTWGLGMFARCQACLPAREQRLQMINLKQELLPRVACSVCGGNSDVQARAFPQGL